MRKKFNRTHNRRAEEDISRLVPMKVTNEIIALCQKRVEPNWKRIVRKIVQPIATSIIGLKDVGEGFHWGLSARAKGAKIGKFVFIGHGCRLSGPVLIGDLTMLSTRIVIVGADHVLDDERTPMRINFPTGVRPITTVEADCWIGHGAILSEGITIARGSVVAAGALVTKDTRPYSIVAGVPAKLLRYRFSKASQKLHDVLLYGRELS